MSDQPDSQGPSDAQKDASDQPLQSQRELLDAKQVTTAEHKVAAKALPEAETILLDVIKHCPKVDQYRNRITSKDGKTMYIKFWNNAAFSEYILIHGKSHGDQKVVAIPNAYPRAFYTIAFIMVSQGRYAEAIQYLRAGAQLQRNPVFYAEMATAFTQIGKADVAKQCYYAILSQFKDVITYSMIGRAFRGLGYIAVEEKSIVEAENFYMKSLNYDPSSAVVRGELQYIQKLKHDAALLQSDKKQSIMHTTSSNVNICHMCGAGNRAGHIKDLGTTSQFTCTQCEQLIANKNANTAAKPQADSSGSSNSTTTGKQDDITQQVQNIDLDKN